MGILYHSSSLLLRDARVTKPGKMRTTTRRKLMKRRREYYGGLFEEARVWMYAMLLPTDVIANGNQEIQANLDDTFNQLRLRLLGSHVTEDKISRVCGKIARNLLVPSLANLDPGCEYYPPEPSADELADFLDDKHILGRLRKHIETNHPELLKTHPNAQTWRDFRTAASGYFEEGEPLAVRIANHQKRQTLNELGLPRKKIVSIEQKRTQMAAIQSPYTWKLVRNDDYYPDLIIVANIAKNDQYIATMRREGTIMALHPAFFEDKYVDSLRDLPVKPRGNDLQLFDVCRLTTLLHEVTHSRYSLWTSDQQFVYYSLGDIDILPAYAVPQHPRLLNRYVACASTNSAIGLEACLALTRRDDGWGTNKAEDNAESWALYFTFKMLILAYPELDFVSDLETLDPYRITKRETCCLVEPLHHCSLFECLRHWGDIKGSPYYYRPYDYWGEATGRHYDPTPAGLLEELHFFDQQRQEEEKAKQP